MFSVDGLHVVGYLSNDYGSFAGRYLIEHRQHLAGEVTDERFDIHTELHTSHTAIQRHVRHIAVRTERRTEREAERSR